ncbi:ribonuclease H-like domain-containing protein, partial [Ephemerocybe angulata]
RCFPHITNLSCKAVLAAVTNLALAAVTEGENEPEYEAVSVGIRSSSLHRQRFHDLQKAFREPLELLRDVDTRWSSTLLMIERFLQLKDYIIKMLKDRDLEKYVLQDHEWAVLEAYVKILRVPHAFQQKLSAEKTPTLHRALPSFHAMISRWKEMKTELPRYSLVIDAGISKLQDYWNEVKDVPAYTLAM